MSRLRHERKHRLAGGMTSKPQWNAGGTQNAAKEAEELKKGGRVKHHGEGDKAKHRADRPKRAKGGHVTAHAAHSKDGTHHDVKTHHNGMHVDGTGGEMTKRAHGGALNKPVHEGHPHHNLHPHKRARGGRLRGEGMGADKTPLTTAAKIKEVVPGELPPGGVRSD